MEINLHNYEAFFLDHKEGNLSAGQEKELFLFLEQQPHLYEELHAFENVVLEDMDAGENFANKSAVKKSDFTNEDLISYVEGLLDEQSKKEIDTLALQNNAFNQELTFYSNTKVQSDLSEKFKNKTKLKRGGLVIALQNNYTFLRVAAAVLLLVGLFFLMMKLITKEETGKNKVEIANINKKAVSSREKQEQRSKSKEIVSSKQLAVSSREKQEQLNKSKEIVSSKQLAVSSREKQEQLNKSKEKVSSKQLAVSSQANRVVKSNNVAVNSVQTNNVSANNNEKNNQKDLVAEKVFVAENNMKQENPAIDRSYFNYSAAKDEDETPVAASVGTGKKSFFQKLVKVAKKANNLGVKNVDATEEIDSNSLSIGGFVVEESISSRPANKN